MKRGHLSEYFEGVAVKTLSTVDTTPSRSNQHEIGTNAEMRRFLGSERRQFAVCYLWLCGEQESVTETGWATHYDTRENQPRPAEWRLYYPSNPVTEVMAAGDTLFVAKRPGDVLLFIVTPAGSTIQNQLLWLFGFAAQPELRFATQDYQGENDAELDFTTRFILDEIGIEFEDSDANSLDKIIERFGTSFPTTRVFSDLARLTLPEVDPRDDPDGAMVAWVTHEEALFRRLERRAVTARLEQGFMAASEVDVDGFLQFSLQVQNRRKSRMGRAFENHLDAVFRAFGLKYEWQATTEQRNTVDFLFPGSAEYHDPTYPEDRLTFLAAKSTCKDRWRQVLPEAQRVWPKHLVTLEPSISVTQTDQMQSERVRLVVPQSIQASYQPGQQVWLLSLANLIDLVRERQGA